MEARRTFVRTAFVALPIIAGSVAMAMPASANDRDVIAEGRCSGRSSWKLKGGPRDGGIEMEFEVDSNVRGQVWSVRITDNGVLVFQGSRTTVGPSGSFEVDRRIPNRAGVDHIVAVATNSRTGERCRGAIDV